MFPKKVARTAAKRTSGAAELGVATISGGRTRSQLQTTHHSAQSSFLIHNFEIEGNLNSLGNMHKETVLSNSN